MSTTANAEASTVTTLGRFAAARKRKAAIEADLRKVKAELSGLETELLEQFADQGVTSQKDAATGATVYMIRKTWARAAEGVDRGTAAEALKRAGMGQYVHPDFNVQTLSAHFTEQRKQREEEGDLVPDSSVLLPDELRGFISLADTFSLGAKL